MGIFVLVRRSCSISLFTVFDRLWTRIHKVVHSRSCRVSLLCGFWECVLEQSNFHWFCCCYKKCLNFIVRLLCGGLVALVCEGRECQMLQCRDHCHLELQNEFWFFPRGLPYHLRVAVPEVTGYGLSQTCLVDETLVSSLCFWRAAWS